MFPSYRNQSVDLQSKSTGWFLCDGNIGREKVKERHNQCVNSIAFKYFDNQCPHYLNEVFMKAPESSSSLRNISQKLQQPFRKTNTGQNALSFIGPALWNKIPEEIKKYN